MPSKPSLDSLLHPKSIAVVGASPRARMGLAIIKNAKLVGMPGAIMPVNPKYNEIAGLPCFASLSELPERPDCAVLIVSADGALQLVEEAGELGIRSAVVVANGFADARTEEGRARQHRLVEIADRFDMAIAGPNCLGVSSIVYRFANTYTDLPAGARPGGLSIISQSGGLLNAAAAYAHDRGSGLNYLISGGNHAVVDIPDYIDFLADDPQTKVIACIMEGAGNGRRFRAAIERASPKKPIVVLKLGRSETGKRATLAHTGTLAGSDDAYAALFRQNGVAQAFSIDDLMETAMVLADARLPAGENVAMLTISGGTTGLIADLGEAAGLHFPPLSAATNARLSALFGVDQPLNNPIDTTGWPQLSDEGQLDKALDIMLADEAIDLIALVYRLTPGERDWRLLADLARRARGAAKPIVFASTVSYTIGAFRAGAAGLEGLPIAEDLESAQRAISRLIAYGLYRRRVTKKAAPPVVPQAIDAMAGRKSLTEFESKAILRDHGLPVTREALARDADEAARLAASIGFPVALKIQSPDMPHKSDAGGVALNLHSSADVREAFARILAKVAQAHPDAAIDGMLVQEMVPPGVEMILGMTRDAQLGPLILCGLGGIFVEIVKDVALRFPPLDSDEARAMLAEIRGAKLLEGYRGSPPCDIDALVETLVRFGDFVVGTDGLFDAVDINPLIVGGKGSGVRIADALIIPAAAPN